MGVKVYNQAHFYLQAALNPPEGADVEDLISGFIVPLNSVVNDQKVVVPEGHFVAKMGDLSVGLENRNGYIHWADQNEINTYQEPIDVGEIFKNCDCDDL